MCKIDKKTIKLVRLALNYMDLVFYVKDSNEELVEGLVEFIHPRTNVSIYNPISIYYEDGKIMLDMVEDTYTLFEFITKQELSEFEQFQKFNDFIETMKVDYLEGIF